jgi:DNA repair protein RadA/Sms
LADIGRPIQSLLELVPSLAEDVGDEDMAKRILSGPWDPCFGGGIVTTSTTLLGADAGAGKSTLCLQIADAIAGILERDVLYISVEMLRSEVRMNFAKRLALKNLDKIRVFSLVTDQSQLGQLEEIVKAVKPAAMFVDSISKLAQGDRDGEVMFATLMKKLSATYESPSVLIAHINKEGDLAGLQALQHEVDAVLSFHVEPDGTRILECPTKNRFGKTPIFVPFDMTEQGLAFKRNWRVDGDDPDEDEEDD